MSKRSFMSGYRTYSGERGSEASWRGAFAARMGIDEARQRVGAEAPEDILNMPRGASWADVKKAYRAAALACHPDRAVLNHMSVAEATEKFKKVQAAYTVLENRRN